MIEGFCEFFMFPWIFGGVKPVIIFNTIYQILLETSRTLLLAVSLHIM